ncbi:MAG: hypothetical protein ACOH1Y_14835 [Propionicimonas sp.]
MTNDSAVPVHVSVHADAVTLSSVRFGVGSQVVAAVLVWADLTAVLDANFVVTDDEGWHFTGGFACTPQSPTNPTRPAVDGPADGITILAARPWLVDDGTDVATADEIEAAHEQVVAAFLHDLDSFMSASAAITAAGGSADQPAQAQPPLELLPSEFFDLTLPVAVVAMLHATTNNPDLLPLVLVHGAPPADPVRTITLTTSMNPIRVVTDGLNATGALDGLVHPGYLIPLPDIHFDGDDDDSLERQAQHTLFGSLTGCALGYQTDLIRLKSLAAWVALGFNSLVHPDGTALMTVDAFNTAGPDDHDLDDDQYDEDVEDAGRADLCAVIIGLLDSAIEEAREETQSALNTIDPFTHSHLPSALLQLWANAAHPDIIAALNAGAEMSELLVDDYGTADVIMTSGIYLAALSSLFTNPATTPLDETVPISVVMLNWLSPDDYHHWWALGALTHNVDAFDTHALADILSYTDDPDEDGFATHVLPYYLHELAVAMDSGNWTTTTLTDALRQSEVTPPDLEDAIEIAAILAAGDHGAADSHHGSTNGECPHGERANDLIERVSDRGRLINGAACLLPLLADAVSVAHGYTPDDEHWAPVRTQFIHQVLTHTAALVSDVTCECPRHLHVHDNQ